MNTVRYPNFTAMNDHLLQGYLDYASNATSAHPSASVYVAPVGLAFAKIHDDLLAAGTDPDQSGTLFHDLYTSDGSHPSLHGSYLLQPPSMPPSMVALRRSRRAKRHQRQRRSDPAVGGRARGVQRDLVVDVSMDGERFRCIHLCCGGR